MFTNFTNRTAISMTALTLLATSAFGAQANEPENELGRYTYYLVSSAVAQVKQEISLDITHEVLTASHIFEPTIEEDNSLMADITITPMTQDSVTKKDDV